MCIPVTKIKSYLIVTEFAKKSGDYTSLSATDIKVIALTYQLEKEKVGTSHLKDAPTIRNIKSTAEKQNEDDIKLPIGFYVPNKKVRYFHKFLYVCVYAYNVWKFSLSTYIFRKNQNWIMI